jgi:DNA adenine methylase
VDRARRGARWLRAHVSAALAIGRDQVARQLDADRQARRLRKGALGRAELRACDYRETLEDAGRGDVVYIDSPHDIRSRASSFTSYTAGAFTQHDQVELSAVAKQLAAKGAHVILSNADTPLIQSLYRGFRVDRVSVPRLINSVAGGRGAVAEVIITVR